MPIAPPPPGAGGPADGPKEWYFGLPKITRWWLTAVLGSTILSSVGMLSPMTLYLDWHAIVYKLQIWRLITNFCFLGKFSWPFVMNVIFMVQYSKTLEKDYQGQAADFLWMLILGGSVLMSINFFADMGMPFLTIPLLFMTIWICFAWVDDVLVRSRKHPNGQMSVFGLFNIQSANWGPWMGWATNTAYFPWFLIVLTMLMGGSPVANLMGYFVGHLYYFFKENYPATRDHRFFFAPDILRRWIEPEGLDTSAAAGGVYRAGGGIPPWGGRGAAPAAPAAQAAARPAAQANRSQPIY